MSNKILTYVEIDIDYCSLSYGVSPCTASIGVTGDIKCFNTKRTCQDTPNFTNDPVTLRFALDTAYLPDDIECIPCIKNLSYSPAKISLGENLGERASVTLTLEDHRHSDAGEGFDKYHAERPYDPYTQGTLFGKFRARQPFLRGRNLRLIRGTLGQSIEEMETRHFVIDSFDGPNPSGGSFSIVAKDVLKLADNDRALAPAVSNGFIISAIDDNDTAISLSPSGIGDLEYPASGHVVIGGDEIVSFTRSGDNMTIVRGQLGTIAVEHDAQDRVQLVLNYEGETPAFIIHDLLTNYAGIDPAYISLSTWETEVAAYNGRLYSAVIADPLGVNKLVSEVIEQAALAVWWDDVNQTIRLQVLRSISTDAATFDQNNTMEGSLATKEQPNSRISQIWTYYGQKNPLKPLDEVENWRSALASVDLEREEDYGSSAIKRIYARWIPTFARTVADRLNTIMLSRYRDPPRSFGLDLFRFGDDPATVVLGGGYKIGGWTIQDATGAETTAPAQVTSINPTEDRYRVTFEELLITTEASEQDLDNRTIIVDADFQEFNLRTIHDGIYPEPVAGSPTITVTCIINEDVIVGSNGADDPAFHVGDWPAGVVIRIVNNGRIQGKAGDGGNSSGSGGPGTGPFGLDGLPGGTALYTRENIFLDNTNGQIWGGGGGGGALLDNSADSNLDGGGGGGGQGQLPGEGGPGGAGNPGQPGTTEAPGVGGTDPGNESRHGGTGGTPGADGDDGNFSFFGIVGFGGAGGDAIDGVSFITFEGMGSILGDQVN